MPIFGVTHEADGRLRQSLAVTTKVAIGLGPDEEMARKAPTKLDHFIFLRKEQSGRGAQARVEWVIDEELTVHYWKKDGVAREVIERFLQMVGENNYVEAEKMVIQVPNPREIEIVLFDDDPDNVFSTQYAWWTQTQKVCWGFGTDAQGRSTATRRTEEHPEGVPWPNCGPGCPDLGEEYEDKGDGKLRVIRKCKPHGDLNFWLYDFPKLGESCRIHTTSYRSIRQINSAIQQVLTITKGILAGVRAKLVVRPEVAIYTDSRQQRRRTTIFALNIVMDSTNVATMLQKITEPAVLFERTRKLLGGRTVEYRVVEPEEEKAPEIVEEFLPPTQTEEGEVVEAPRLTRPARKAETPAAEPAKEPQPQQAQPQDQGKPKVTYSPLESDRSRILLVGDLPALKQDITHTMGGKKEGQGVHISKGWLSTLEEKCKELGIDLVAAGSPVTEREPGEDDPVFEPKSLRSAKLLNFREKPGKYLELTLFNNERLFLFDNMALQLPDGKQVRAFDFFLGEVDKSPDGEPIHSERSTISLKT